MIYQGILVRATESNPETPQLHLLYDPMYRDTPSGCLEATGSAGQEYYAFNNIYISALKIQLINQT